MSKVFLIHWMRSLESKKKSFSWDKRRKLQELLNLEVCQAFHNP